MAVIETFSASSDGTSRFNYEVTAQEATDALIKAFSDWNTANPEEKQFPIEWATLATVVASNDKIGMGLVNTALETHRGAEIALILANNPNAEQEWKEELESKGFEEGSDEWNQAWAFEMDGFSDKFTAAYTSAYNSAVGTNYVSETDTVHSINDVTHETPHGITTDRSSRTTARWYTIDPEVTSSDPSTNTTGSSTSEVKVGASPSSKSAAGKGSQDLPPKNRIGYETKTVQETYYEDVYTPGTPAIAPVYGPPPEILTPVTAPSTFETVPITLTAGYNKAVPVATYSNVITTSSTSAPAFMTREAAVIYKADGVKPKTEFNAYINNVNVTKYIDVAMQIEVSKPSGSTHPFSFDKETRCGVTEAREEPRKYADPTGLDRDNPLNAFTSGDVIYGMTSGHTAVVVDWEPTASGNILLFVVNTKNGNAYSASPFQAGESITASLSNSIGIVESIVTSANQYAAYTAEGFKQKSSNYGKLCGVLRIPNNGIHRFPAGTNTIMFSSADIDSIYSESFVKSSFTSTGTRTTITNTNTHTESWHNVQEWVPPVMGTKQIEIPGVTTITKSTGEPVLISPGVDAVGGTTTQVLRYKETTVDDYDRPIYAEQTATVINDGASSNDDTARDDSQTIADITEVGDGRTLVATASYDTEIDPLCQTFFVPEESGIFLTGLDLFFVSKPTDSVTPFFVSIINVVNGYPGGKAFIDSEIYIKHEDCILSTNTVTIDGVDYPAPDTPTHIEFKTPVYLPGGKGKSYGIYIKSESKGYNLWTNYMGEADTGGSGLIDEQPLLGSLFKSQNAETWTTDQYEDLTFELYRASFDTSAAGNIDFISDNSTQNKKMDGFFMFLRSGSSLARIRMFANGLHNGDRVTISGIAINDVSGNPITYGGVYAGTDLNGEFTVSGSEMDSFIIDIGENMSTPAVATSTEQLKSRSDWDITITKNINIDMFKPVFTEMILSKTKIGYKYKGFHDTSYTSLNNLRNHTVESPMKLRSLSPENEIHHYSGGNSMSLNAHLTSSDEKVSPRILLSGTYPSILTTNFRINNPVIGDYSSDLDKESFVATNITVNVVGNTLTDIFSTDAGTMEKFALINHGFHVTIYDGNSNASTLLGTFPIHSVTNNNITVKGLPAITGTNIFVEYSTRWRDETVSGGSSSISKYATKILRFGVDNTGFKLAFTYNKPVGTEVEFYYRTSKASDEAVDHRRLKYEKIQLTLPTCEGKRYFREGTGTVTGLQKFDSMNIKIVYKSDDSSVYPTLKDFRIIAVV